MFTRDSSIGRMHLHTNAIPENPSFPPSISDALTTIVSTLEHLLWFPSILPRISSNRSDSSILQENLYACHRVLISNVAFQVRQQFHRACLPVTEFLLHTLFHFFLPFLRRFHLLFLFYSFLPFKFTIPVDYRYFKFILYNWWRSIIRVVLQLLLYKYRIRCSYI